MKKLLITITIIAILGILVAVGFFGYNKFQEVELEKDKLQAQQKENKNIDNSSEDVSNIQPSKEMEQDTEPSNEKVTRDNVFDYLFAGMEQDDDSIWEKDKLIFQDPIKSPETGKWEILANNKGGSGSYVFRVTPNGDVEFYDSLGKELRLSVPVEL